MNIPKREVPRRNGYVFVVLIALMGCVQVALAQDWIPDANLRNSVRTALSLNADEPLTQQKMLNLNGLNANRLGICDEPQIVIGWR